MQKRLTRIGVLVLAASLFVALGAYALGFLRVPTHPELCATLTQHRVAHVFTDGGTSLECARVTTGPLSPELQGALSGGDASALVAALSQEKGRALSVAPGLEATGLRAQLAALSTPPGLRALAVGPQLAVYAPRAATDFSLRERDALAYVARALLRGAREPNVNSFPPSMRRVERVEVMVLLRERGEPRLWRSARGTSVARALLTAARVARDRWRERETAMGGPLTKRLLDLDVEVALLLEDGSLLSTERRFVDGAVTDVHGVGFEYLSGWHYILPSDMARRGKGSAHAAFLELLRDQGLSPATLAESALRPYRFITELLGVSRAPLGPEPTPG